MALTTEQQQNASTIANIANQYGVPSYIPLTIAMQESSLTNKAPSTDSNGKLSTGLFQLNQGGVGAGYNPASLVNPTLNTTIAIKKMAPVYKQAVKQGIVPGYATVQYVANTSGWPGNAGAGKYPAYDQGLQRAYQNVTGQTATGGVTSSPTTASTPPGQYSAPSGIGGYVKASMWSLLGIALAIVGIWILFNPFSDLSSAIRSASKGLAKMPLEGAADKVRNFPTRQRITRQSEQRDRISDGLYVHGRKAQPQKVKPRDIVGDLNEGF